MKNKRRFLFIVLLLLIVGRAYGQSFDKLHFRPYGFIKLSAIGANAGVGSSNAINQVASTQAAPRQSILAEESRLTFQAQQSRIGLFISQEKEFQGRFEFDFLDRGKSTPTTQMVPRLRIASITLWEEGYRLIIGQDWDLFSPLGPYTFNYVGNYFMAGNSGFIRQQVQYLKDHESFEYGLALGLSSSNPTNQDGDLEITKTPSYSGRVAYLLHEGRVGFSGLYTNFKYQSMEGPRRDSYGLNTFIEKKWSLWELKSEFYYGQNLANTGANTLGRGSFDSDVKEWGGFVSFYYDLNKYHVFGGVGLSRITNPGELHPLSVNANRTVVHPGVLSNMAIKLGIKKQIKGAVDWISEISRFQTEYQLPDGKELNTALALETGVKLSF